VDCNSRSITRRYEFVSRTHATPFAFYYSPPFVCSVILFLQLSSNFMFSTFLYSQFNNIIFSSFCTYLSVILPFNTFMYLLFSNFCECSVSLCRQFSIFFTFSAFSIYMFFDVVLLYVLSSLLPCLVNFCFHVR
jgi:hypothetical protein